MEAFLNELSLHAQFQDTEAVGEAVRKLNFILARLTELPKKLPVLYDAQLYQSHTTAYAVFSASLKRIPDKSISTQFVRLFKERLDAQRWVDQRRHEDCVYECQGQDVRGSSVAELAERYLQQGQGFLLNFSPSQFGHGTASVTKQEAATAELDLVNSVEDLRSWCGRFPDIFPVTYDPECNRHPRDPETVLRDRGRFRKTPYLVQGCSVYMEISSGSYWYIDHLHVGAAAHLEVFNAGRRHIGEASLEGVLDESKVDPAKRLDI